MGPDSGKVKEFHVGVKSGKEAAGIAAGIAAVCWASKDVNDGKPVKYRVKIRPERKRR